MVKISQLKNGLRVATLHSPSHFVGVGVYVRCGSRYETLQNRGVSALMEKMAFKSTHTRTHQEVQDMIENMGGNIQASSTRETLMLQGVTFQKHVGQLVALYADTIQNYTLQEIDECKLAIDWEIQQQAEKVTEHTLPQLSHAAAFGDCGLGIPPATSQCKVAKRQLEQSMRQFYQPANMVVAAVGCDHEQIVQQCQEHFGSLASSRHVVDQNIQSDTKYQGGVKLQQYIPPPHHPPNLKDLTHIQLSFESPAFVDPDIYATSVLQMLLGGGDSFSAGGPGKGMYSRLYTNVLNRYYWVESVLCSNTCYSDTGLFTLHATIPHAAIEYMLTILGREIQSLLNNGITDEEIQRAKNQLRSSLFMNLESKMVSVEDIGRQVLLNGSRLPSDVMRKRIGDVTQTDIKRVMRNMLSKQPTFVLMGNTKHMPDFNKFKKQFGIGSG